MMFVRFTVSWSVMESVIVLLLMALCVETQRCPDVNCCPHAQPHRHTTYNSQTTVLRQITPPLIVCTSPPYRSPNRCTHPPKQFKFTCPPKGNCNPYRFTTPVPCKCTPAPTCESPKKCTKMQPRCNCASRLASKMSSHVAEASMHAEKASSHAAKASSLAADLSSLTAKAFEISTPRSPTKFTTMPPRGSCGPHLVAENAKHFTQKETRSTRNLPVGKHSTSTTMAPHSITTAENTEPVSRSIDYRPQSERTSLNSVETVTPTVSSTLVPVPTTRFKKKMPEGKCGPYLAVESADHAERQKTRSTGILPETKHSFSTTMTADSIATAKNPVEYRPQSERTLKFSEKTATPTISNTHAPLPTTRCTKKVPAGNRGSYLATGRSAQPTFMSTKTLPEVERDSRSMTVTGYPPKMPTVRSTKKRPEFKGAPDLVAQAADRTAQPVLGSTGIQPEAKRASLNTANIGNLPTQPSSRFPKKKVPQGKCGLYLSSEATGRTEGLANRPTGNSPEAKLTSRYAIQTGTSGMLPTVRSKH